MTQGVVLPNIAGSDCPTLLAVLAQLPLQLQDQPLLWLHLLQELGE